MAHETKFFMVDKEYALKYGINEAIILDSLRRWIDHNRENGRNFYDGRYWSYNSLSAWQKLIPILSKKQIRTALSNLIGLGVLVTGNYNKKAYDKTIWYAFADELVVEDKPISKKAQAYAPEGTTYAPEGTPIPIDYQYNNTNKHIYLSESGKPPKQKLGIRKIEYRLPEEHPLNNFIQKTFPDTVGSMQVQMTAKECDALKKEFTPEFIIDILGAMSIWHRLHERKDVYKTFRTFARNKEQGFKK